MEGTIFTNSNFPNLLFLLLVLKQSKVKSAVNKGRAENYAMFQCLFFWLSISNGKKTFLLIYLVFKTLVRNVTTGFGSEFHFGSRGLYSAVLCTCAPSVTSATRFSSLNRSLNGSRLSITRKIM